MSKRLIVAVDFSSYALEQLRLAAAWKKQYGWETIVLHKIELIFPTLTDRDQRLRLEYDLKREAKSQINELLEEAGLDINTPTHIFTESLTVFIKDSGKISPEDIVVLGIKGTGSISRFLIGSTTTQLIDLLPNVIIGVPKELRELLPEKLMVSVHYKKGLNEKALLEIIQSLSGKLNKIEFVSVVTPQDDLDKSSRFLEKLSSEFSPITDTESRLFMGDDALDALKSFYQDFEHSFLVVQKGSRSFTDQLFRKFMINELVYNNFAPLIILP
ncbi:universal stress protein [Arthrospiribacter ruber]|uniref:Universal stress protein n=1 Tax=Arthrospiribacter ruber TaxID=2487934 RepID=A0A951IXI3_9BACT|nr:universal stress protein [Arthrospiribacter ruber]MBW3467944.1 universal stress protein [Arthrospiribacter ruber]